MFAVIKTGGKQYRVAAQDVIEVERIAGNAGDVVELGSVLMVGAGDDVSFGAPFVEGALVTAEVIEQNRGPKVLSFKKRRRQNSKRIRGHRQLLTTLRISEILTGGAKPSAKPAKAKPEAKAEAAEGKKPEAAAKEAAAEKPAKPAKAKAEAAPAAEADAKPKKAAAKPKAEAAEKPAKAAKPKAAAAEKPAKAKKDKSE